MSKTRAEHMAWCKQRATDEFNFYMQRDGLDAAIRNSVASMVSDLGKHPETRGSQQFAMLLGQTIKATHDLHGYINGFN